MKKMTFLLLAVLLVVSLALPAAAAEFTIDQYAILDGMGRSWYQGYEPVPSYDKLTLYLPLCAKSCTGDITVSIALNDPNVYLLAAEPKAVSVSPKDGIYPVKLSLSLQRNRHNGDFPATITIQSIDESGKEIMETMPYILRIRDGSSSHEMLEPVLSDMVGDLNVGSEGSLIFTITNPTVAISMTDVVVTVTDTTEDVLMAGSERLAVQEILPGKTETVTIPMTIRADASISQHTLEVTVYYKALGREETWTERFTVPVTQAIRLEQGGVQLPSAIAGELANMSLPLMNMGKGELSNVYVTLEVKDILDAQSVLVGTITPGETKQAKLTFIPGLEVAGTHSGTVTITGEDAYGNQTTQILDITLTVQEPLPEVTQEQKDDPGAVNPWIVFLIILSILLAVGLVVQGKLMTDKLHKLEEDRL